MGANEKHEAAYHGGETPPNLDNVRTEWAHSVSYTPEGWVLAVEQFDRLIQLVKAKAKAEAWDECAREFHEFDPEANDNPYK